MTDTTATTGETETGQQETQTSQQAQATQGETSFSQADVDKIVRDRLAQQAKNKFGDYETLKAKADGAKTLEDRFSEMEQRTAQAEARALRSDIAAKYKISAEDRDLFLTGVDQESLETQAKRLAERDAANKTKGNVARNEGGTKTTGSPTSDIHEFARGLFGEDN